MLTLLIALLVVGGLAALTVALARGAYREWLRGGDSFDIGAPLAFAVVSAITLLIILAIITGEWTIVKEAQS